VVVDTEIVLLALVPVDMEGMVLLLLLGDMGHLMQGMQMQAAMEEVVLAVAVLSATCVNRKVTLQKNVQITLVEVELGPPMVATVAMVVVVLLLLLLVAAVVAVFNQTSVTNVGKVATLPGIVQVKEEVEVVDMVGEALVEVESKVEGVVMRGKEMGAMVVVIE
jgi:hypothetical protein